MFAQAGNSLTLGKQNVILFGLINNTFPFWKQLVRS